MKKTNRKKQRLLRELEDNPMVQQACKKVGIARSTFYRWCESDRKFYYLSELARSKGRDKLNDYVESKLLENVKNGQQTAIQFWLSNNSKIYRSTNVSWQSRLKQMESDETERHQEIMELLDVDEAIRMLEGNPEILNKAIKQAIKGEFQWLVHHSDEEDV